MGFFGRICAIFPVLGLAAASAGPALLPGIPAVREPVTNLYQGVAVVDDYQWLEDGTNPAVRDWTRRQNERTRAWFDQLKFHDGLSRSFRS
jgi:hypothetical protein